MKPIRQFLPLILGILFLFPHDGYGQTVKPVDADREALLKAAREIMNSANTCNLITLDEDGRARARVMDPFPPEEDFTVWFGTNPESRKVDQIRNDPRVTLYYLAGDASGYVVVYGKAKLVDDPEEKESRWKEAWQAFYPNREDAYLLIEVIPEWLEVISFPHGITGDPDTWEAPAVFFAPD